MLVRKSTMEDLPEIMETYAYARKLMRETGNRTQWGETEPPERKVVSDIKNGWGYVIEEDGVLCGAFAFIIGPDPMYREIIDGAWLNDTDLYGTIHRLGTNGKARGIFDACLDFCEGQISNLRIDTHKDNTAMLHLISKRGFQRCGIIFVEDGTPRIAFQKIM